VNFPYKNTIYYNSNAVHFVNDWQ